MKRERKETQNLEEGTKKILFKRKIEDRAPVPLARGHWGEGTGGTEELAEHNLPPTQCLQTTLLSLLSEKFLTRDV